MYFVKGLGLFINNKKFFLSTIYFDIRCPHKKCDYTFKWPPKTNQITQVKNC